MASKKKTAQARKRSRPVEPKKTKIDSNILIVIVLAAIVIIAVGLFLTLGNQDNNNDNQTTSGNPIAIIDTSMGTIKVELFMDKAPITAKNFYDHSKSGYYTGVIFHRVIPSFMIQGGDPLGTGGGGHAAEYHEGYGTPENQDSWVIPDEFHEDLSNVRGTISMANRGPNTGGSQFFINVVDNTNLDYNKEPLTSKHAVFGKVIDGMDIADAISNVDKDISTNKPDTDVVINSITIEG